MGPLVLIGLLSSMTIFSWYDISMLLKEIETLLEECLLEEWDLPLVSLELLIFLIVSMSMSIVDGKGYISEEVEVLNDCFGNLEGIKNNIFTSFILGTTIQNKDKKKEAMCSWCVWVLKK